MTSAVGRAVVLWLKEAAPSPSLVVIRAGLAWPVSRDTASRCFCSALATTSDEGAAVRRPCGAWSGWVTAKSCQRRQRCAGRARAARRPPAPCAGRHGCCELSSRTTAVQRVLPHVTGRRRSARSATESATAPGLTHNSCGTRDSSECCPLAAPRLHAPEAPPSRPTSADPADTNRRSRSALELSRAKRPDLAAQRHQSQPPATRRRPRRALIWDFESVQSVGVAAEMRRAGGFCAHLVHTCGRSRAPDTPPTPERPTSCSSVARPSPSTHVDDRRRWAIPSSPADIEASARKHDVADDDMLQVDPVTKTAPNVPTIWRLGPIGSRSMSSTRRTPEACGQSLNSSTSVTTSSRKSPQLFGRPVRRAGPGLRSAPCSVSPNRRPNASTATSSPPDQQRRPPLVSEGPIKRRQIGM